MTKHESSLIVPSDLSRAATSSPLEYGLTYIASISTTRWFVEVAALEVLLRSLSTRTRDSSDSLIYLFSSTHLLIFFFDFFLRANLQQA